jgi:hypothetical protein
VSRYVERVCQCGCGETFMARASDVKRGYGLYKNRSHATRGANNPRWLGVQHNAYLYKLRSIARYPLRHKCRHIYAYAVKRGILKRGCCEFCGNPHTQGHHED